MSEEKKNKKKKKTSDAPIDDGRVIVDMNVEGMPWYRGLGQSERPPVSPDEKPPEVMTRGEKAAMIRGVVGAALAVAAVFGVGDLLLILLCLRLWS